MFVNGQYVSDPNPEGSSQTNIYTKLNPNGTVDESSIIQNSENYLIVPENYNPSEAVIFSDNLEKEIIPEKILEMASAFRPGGSQDLQRGERWDIPKNEVIPAFRDAASWNFGYLTKLANIPITDAIRGAGLLNSSEYKYEKIKSYLGFGGAPTQKLDGPMGMSEIDYKDFLAGVKSGEKMEKAGAAGFMTWLRSKVIAGATGKSSSKLKTILDLALARGQGQFGGFAPIPRVVSSKLLSLVPRTGREASALVPAARLAMGNTGTLAPGSRRYDGNISSQKGGVVQDNVPIAQIRQHQVTALRVANLASTLNLMADRPFAPVGLRGKETAARFKTASSAAQAEMLASGGAAYPQAEALVPMNLKMTPGAVDRLTAARQRGADSGGTLGVDRSASDPVRTAQFKQALDDFFFRQSRLPPTGCAAFDTRLSPIWAGVKLPG